MDRECDWDGRRWLRLLLLTVFSSVLLVGGCGSSSESPTGGDPYYDEFGVEPFEAEGPMGKADNAGVPGPKTSFDGSDTAVWLVKNQWEDTDTAAARKAGMAWSENSGLNWDQKYAAWIQAMKKIPAVSYGDTFEMMTPWGKSLPAPKLECAEVAMFLRLTFAAWYDLPFYMTTVDAQGKRVYFGHMGAITSTGRYKNMPRYKRYYADHSGMSPAQYQADWPEDAKLRSKGLYGGGDSMPFIGEGAKAGAYFDEVHLNKRVGHFALHLLSYFGSINLASSRNTFNLKPEALSPGDVLVERWQKKGIGHTLVTKSVSSLEGGRLEAQLVSGSMPRRQPKWESAVASKNSFTDERTGGEGTSHGGEEYAKLGGGLKRWRVAKNWQGRWTNSWMNADEANWINDTDYEAIKKRPARFETLLGEVPPEQLRDALLEIIADARQHLTKYPASCSARTKREHAWRDLYKLLQQKFSMSKAEADAKYRVLDDYVFAELEYEKSKTCCWNSTTNSMYQIIMDKNQSLQNNACTSPVVFMNTNGGYQLFKDHATSLGKGSEWVEWSEDEPCSQRNVQDDTEMAHDWTPWCSINQGGSGGSGGAGGTGGTGGSGNASGSGGAGGTGGIGGSGGSSQPSCTTSNCGSSTPVPGSNPGCYCDSYCVQNNDCCPSYAAVCGG